MLVHINIYRYFIMYILYMYVICRVFYRHVANSFICEKSSSVNKRDKIHSLFVMLLFHPNSVQNIHRPRFIII